MVPAHQQQQQHGNTDWVLPTHVGDDLMKITGHFRIPSIWYFCCQKVPFFHENLGFHLLNLSVSPTFFSEEERKRTLR